MEKRCDLTSEYFNLNFQKHLGGLFNRFFYASQKSDRFAAVDDPVIVGERNVHHGPNDDLALSRDWALLNRMHA
jgi:hypothetical protein